MKNVILYHKIENLKNIDLETLSQLKMEWVALEKVHGSNFSISVSEKHIEFGKRSGPLSLTASFFGFQTIIEEEQKKARKCFDLISKNVKDLEMITIYGEIFGGKYPHKDVKENPNVKFVQKGLWYSPNLHFYAFDIRTTPGGIMDYDEAMKYFEESGFLYAKPIMRGKLDDLIKFDVETFETQLPEILGLPKLEKNFAEGIVIKTIKPFYLKSERAIIKKKTKAFTEVNVEKKLKQKEKKKEIEKENEEREEELKDVINTMKCYITENRLHNVLSKIEKIKSDQIPMLIGLFAKDVFEDFTKENKDFENLKEEEKKHIKKNLSDSCKKLITKYSQDILDGKF